jgi:hypothetical protein
VIQHYDLVAPAPISTTPAEPRIKSSKIIKKDKEPAAAPKVAAPVLPIQDFPIGAGSLIPPASEEENVESIGFAELLFQSPSEAAVAKRGGHWGQGAGENFASGEVGNWGLEQTDTSPWWLKAAVFIGGSMVIGAILAHQSGHALWQKSPAPLFPAAATAHP